MLQRIAYEIHGQFYAGHFVFLLVPNSPPLARDDSSNVHELQTDLLESIGFAAN